MAKVIEIPIPSPQQRALRTYPLGALDVAPENARFDEPADDDIPQLASTILAAGVLQPLTVRPGRRKEAPVMVLDGRRRLLALRRLLEDGAVAEDYAVPAFEETEPARQAAAVLLTNTGAPVHIADVIASIGKMLKAKLTPAIIAGALGYAELEVRRLAALSTLHPKALEALKAGRMTLRQAKLLARLPDRKVHAEMAQQALDGYGFQEWRIAERLDAKQVTVADRRFALVGAAAYGAAEGRTEADLFGERAAVLLDPDILQALWEERAREIAAALAADGRAIHVSVDAGEVEDETLETFGYAYGLGLDGAAQDAWRDAQGRCRAAQTFVEGLDLSAPDTAPAIAAYLEAKIAADVAGEPARDVTLLQVFAHVGTGLAVTAYGPPAPEAEEPELADADDAAADSTPATRAPPVPARTPVAMPAAPVLGGVNHALHEVRTDMGTRVLIRALADDPQAALIALIARLFDAIVRRAGVGKGGAALAIAAEPYSRPGRVPVPSLDGEVRERLAARRAAWEASGQSALAWVASLEAETRLSLLAELTALSLDLREERTTSLRTSARAEAAEIAALCDADAARWWTPDEAYLRAHAKPQLLAMLVDMEVGDPTAGAKRKDELVGVVAQAAEARSWAPPDLAWGAAAQPEPPADDAPSGDVDADGEPPWEGETAWPETGAAAEAGEAAPPAAPLAA